VEIVETWRWRLEMEMVRWRFGRVFFCLKMLEVVMEMTRATATIERNTQKYQK